MSKKIGSILLLILGGSLLIYTATRTYHLFTLTLPADQQILGVLALAAFDGGLVLWPIYFLNGARGAWQRGIAALMIIVSLVGVIIGFMGDTMLTASTNALITALPPETAQSIIIATGAIISINIAAVVFTHVLDPDNLRAMQEQEAEDQITSQSLKMIGQQSKAVAAEVAPDIAYDWAMASMKKHRDGLEHVRKNGSSPKETVRAG